MIGGNQQTTETVMANSPGYVWEKMFVAVGSMCGRGSVEQRLYNATISALGRLNDDDLTGNLQADLRFVLKWTKDNVQGDDSMKVVPGELEHRDLVDKMLHILLETNDAP